MIADRSPAAVTSTYPEELRLRSASGTLEWSAQKFNDVIPKPIRDSARTETVPLFGPRVVCARVRTPGHEIATYLWTKAADHAAVDEARRVWGAKQEQRMANEGLINLFGWCKRERESLQMQREMLQSGKFRIFKDEGSGQVDVSPDSIARITANIAELDMILADYELRSSSAPIAIPVGKLNASNDE